MEFRRLQLRGALYSAPRNPRTCVFRIVKTALLTECAEDEFLHLRGIFVVRRHNRERDTLASAIELFGGWGHDGSMKTWLPWPPHAHTHTHADTGHSELGLSPRTPSH